MTTKTTDKAARTRPESAGEPNEREEAAQRIHTLAQLAYRHLAVTRPWLLPTPPMPYFDAGTGQSAGPWVQGWPVGWNSMSQVPWH